MATMDSESRAYEREIKYQIEEKERREWEEGEINRWEKQLEKNRNDWFNRTKEHSKVIHREERTDKNVVETILGGK
jgi:hypothetical protein